MRTYGYWKQMYFVLSDGKNLGPFWNFIPFGGGPRTTEVAYVVAKMVLEFAGIMVIHVT